MNLVCMHTDVWYYGFKVTVHLDFHTSWQLITFSEEASWPHHFVKLRKRADRDTYLRRALWKWYVCVQMQFCLYILSKTFFSFFIIHNHGKVNRVNKVCSFVLLSMLSVDSLCIWSPHHHINNFILPSCTVLQLFLAFQKQPWKEIVT